MALAAAPSRRARPPGARWVGTPSASRRTIGWHRAARWGCRGLRQPARPSEREEVAVRLAQRARCPGGTRTRPTVPADAARPVGGASRPMPRLASRMPSAAAAPFRRGARCSDRSSRGCRQATLLGPTPCCSRCARRSEAAHLMIGRKRAPRAAQGPDQSIHRRPRRSSCSARRASSRVGRCGAPATRRPALCPCGRPRLSTRRLEGRAKRADVVWCVHRSRRES